MTDSEPVPRGKGEKNPGEGSETEPEIVRLQTVVARRKAGGGIPFA